MRAGKLRHQIDIEQTTESRGTNGEVVDTWSVYATVRAEVIPMQGKESFLASQELGERTVKFRIRYLSGITPKMRVNYDSRLFDIESVVEVNEREHEMHLLTREIL